MRADLRLFPRARQNLAVTVTPLLELISKYTGYSCVTLICAGQKLHAPGYDSASVHVGKTKDTVPKDFYSHDPQAFKAWSQKLVDFARAVKGK